MHGVRDLLLEASKRPALRLLHATPAGEALLCRLYLEAELHAEQTAPWEPLLATAPGWLCTWIEHHRAEERRHALLFARRLEEVTGTRADPHPRVLSGRKLRALHRLIDRHRPRFSAGPVVAALAVAWRMEEMGVRVFRRHVQVLERHRPDAPLLLLLRTVLADERRHARACGRAVERLTLGSERAALAALLARIDRIERRGGVLGALLLLAVGGFLWARAQVGFSISQSPTDAAT